MGIQSQYQNMNLATADATRTPSAGLWHQVDVDTARCGVWHETFVDFGSDMPLTAASLPTTEGIFNGYMAFTSTGGIHAEVDTEGGVYTLGSDGDNEGAGIRDGKAQYKMIVDAGELVFEARIKTTTIADTKHSVFIGLFENTALTVDIPINVDNPPILSAHNMVGFHRLEGDGDKFDTVYKANDQTVGTVKADAVTLVADQWIKVGMTFNRGGDNVLRYYDDGVELVDTYTLISTAGNPFPNDVRLGWCMAVRNGTGSTPGNMEIDWIRIAQKTINET